MNKHYIWIKTKCNDYYKFIKKVSFLNVTLIDLKYENKIIYLKVSLKDYEKLKKFLISYKFSKVKETGIYQLKDYLKKYQIFIICLILGLIFFFLTSNLIVEVNIIHENKEIRELLESELESYGIKVLSFKKSYDYLQEVKAKILEKYEDKLDWLEFVVDGMVYNVRVEERIITDTKKEEKLCHIVAAKDGTISGIKLYAGEASVGLNDYVKEGDILVTGILKYNEEIKSMTCASADIYAHTWYQASISIPFKTTEFTQTGQFKYNLVFNNKGHKTQILRPRYSTYESTYQKIFSLFGYELLIAKEYETKKKEITTNETEALEQALIKAEESVLIKLAEGSRVIDKKVLKKSINDSKMNIEVFLVVEELISKEQTFTIEDIEGNDLVDNKNN